MIHGLKILNISLTASKMSTCVCVCGFEMFTGMILGLMSGWILGSYFSSPIELVCYVGSVIKSFTTSHRYEDIKELKNEVNDLLGPRPIMSITGQKGGYRTLGEIETDPATSYQELTNEEELAIKSYFCGIVGLIFEDADAIVATKGFKLKACIIDDVPFPVNTYDPSIIYVKTLNDSKINAFMIDSIVNVGGQRFYKKNK